MEDLKLQRVHGRIEVYSIEVVKKQDLRISLSSVPRFAAFGWLTDLDYDHVAVVEDWHEQKVVLLFLPCSGKWTHGTTWPSYSYNPEYTLA